MIFSHLCIISVIEAEAPIGQYSIHAEGMNGDDTAPFTTPDDNGLGAIYAEDFTIDDDGDCSFALDGLLTCPLFGDELVGSCDYGATAVIAGPNTLALGFPGFDSIIRISARS